MLWRDLRGWFAAMLALSDDVTTHPYSIAGTGWFMARIDTDTLADTDSPLVDSFSCEPNRIEPVLVNVPAYDLFQIVVNANITDTNRTSFSNTFSTTTDDGRTAGDSTRVSLEGGGDGSGIPGSQLRLQKVVAGDVPADAPSTFTIIATCTAPGSESAVEYSREVPGDPREPRGAGAPHLRAR